MEGWSPDVRRRLRQATAEAFGDEGIARVEVVGVTDLVFPDVEAYLLTRDLAFLREGFVPPKAVYTVSWWCFGADAHRVLPEIGPVTWSNHRKKIDLSRGLLAVVTIDSLGPPDACFPLVFDHDPASGAFRVRPFEVVGAV